MGEGVMTYAFVSHRSAIEALRDRDDLSELRTWPSDVRLLPAFGACVRNQRMAREIDRTIGFATHGIRARPIDLLVPHESMRSRGKMARFHVWKGVLPLESMLRLKKNLLVSKPEFALVQLAGYHTKIAPVADAFGRQYRAEQEELQRLGIDAKPVVDDPFAWDLTTRLMELTMIACELQGSYRVGRGGVPTRYQAPPLATKEQVETLLDSYPLLYGASRVRRALELGFANSASPRETALALMLSLPVEMGGYGLPRPQLNASLDVSGTDTTPAWRESAVPDLSWNKGQLVLEYESEEFHGAAGESRLTVDAARANVLSARGSIVLRATAEMMASVGALDLLARQIAALLGVELAEVDEVGRLRRRRIHALLLRADG